RVTLPPIRLDRENDSHRGSRLGPQHQPEEDGRGHREGHQLGVGAGPLAHHARDGPRLAVHALHDAANFRRGVLHHATRDLVGDGVEDDDDRHHQQRHCPRRHEPFTYLASHNLRVWQLPFRTQPISVSRRSAPEYSALGSISRGAAPARRRLVARARPNPRERLRMCWMVPRPAHAPGGLDRHRVPPANQLCISNFRVVATALRKSVAHPLPFHGSSRGHRKRRDRISHTRKSALGDALGGMDMILKLYTRFQTLTASEEGQDLLEYALLVALIALVCVGAVTLAGKNVNSIFGNVATQLGTAAGS